MCKAINILDTTLCEGGYSNNWAFDADFCREYILTISQSKVEDIEVGFLKDCKYCQNQTYFNQIEEINNVIPKGNIAKICARVEVDKFDITKIVPKTSDIKLDGIRLFFKKHQLDKIFPYLSKIKEMGYELFVNPIDVDEYSDLELIEVFDSLNVFLPNAISLVDTKGFLSKNDITRNFYLMDNHFEKNIKLSCHLYNNIYRSFENTKRLIKECSNKRDLLIDSTAFGLGKEGGFLPIEQISMFINENFEKDYDLVSIINLLNEKIYPIYKDKQQANPATYFLQKIKINKI